MSLVTEFPSNYLHLICVGVMRKLLQLWLSRGPLKVRLPAQDANDISKFLLNLVKHIPCDLNRKPRALTLPKYCKATELRSFLLYLGPIVLRKILHKDLYSHFLLDHIARKIVVCPFLSAVPTNLDYAQQSLTKFFSPFGELYGEKFILCATGAQTRFFATVNSSAMQYIALQRNAM